MSVMDVVVIITVRKSKRAWEEEGEDLTQMAVIDRRDGLPLSKWRGHGVDFFSGLMGELGFQVKAWFEEVWASPPWGRRERGLFVHFHKITSKMTEPCQSRTSSQVNESPKKNFNAQKNCGVR